MAWGIWRYKEWGDTSGFICQSKIIIQGIFKKSINTT